MSVSKQPKKSSRRKIGGNIWNENVRTIKEAIEEISDLIQRANDIIGKAAALVDDKPNVPYMRSIAVMLINLSHYLTDISNQATRILAAIQEIDETAQEMVRREAEKDDDDAN